MMPPSSLHKAVYIALLSVGCSHRLIRYIEQIERLHYQIFISPMWLTSNKPISYLTAYALL